MTVWALLGSAGLILANGFFVAVEFAIIASRTTRLEQLVDEGGRRARLALRSTRDLKRQLTAAQLGITVASLALGAIAEPAVAHLIEPGLEAIGLGSAAVHTIAFIIALAIVAFLHMVIGEMVPKNFAIAEPERMLLWLAPPHAAFVWVFRPVIAFLNFLSFLVVRSTGNELVDEVETQVGAAELLTMLDASRQDGLIEAFEHDLLSGALHFGDREVGTVMVPIQAVTSVSRRMTVAEIEAVIVRSGHSRLPVAGVGSDDFIGVVHAKDLLLLPREAQDEPVPLESIRRMLVIGPTESLESLLWRMRRSRNHFAVVSGEERTLGIVTMEDVVERLVGDIRDESDRPSGVR